MHYGTKGRVEEGPRVIGHTSKSRLRKYNKVGAKEARSGVGTSCTKYSTRGGSEGETCCRNGTQERKRVGEGDCKHDR